MNIGVIHYHLKPGGVTTVIKQHIRATRDRHNFLVFSGENSPDGETPAPVVVLPEIGYDDSDGHPACDDPDRVAAAIVNRLHEQWDNGCDVIHIHNPLLAKNRRFLEIVRALAAKGERLLLQIHDFAEDGRPGSYYPCEEYPENCHLAVINTRDRDILVDAGARPEGVHYIGNAVTPLPAQEGAPMSEPAVLYPVRAIRRKNIGEAILLSLFFENREKLAITLAPNNPADFPVYNGWKSFCADRPVNVLFEASSQRPFNEWVAACRGMVSTSMTEGFGFAFLEPWTALRPLFGRKLADLCVDFEAAGMRLEHLYPRLAVPGEWVDRRLLQEKIRRTVSAGRRAFGLPDDEVAVDRFAALADQKTLDFGLLDEFFQKRVISRVLAAARDRRRLLAENPFLAGSQRTVDREKIMHNNRIVREKFSEKICGEQLTAAYQHTRNVAVAHRLDKARLLSRFFRPDRFSLLQGGAYDGH